MKHKKAQIGIFDLILSVSIVLVITILLAVSWNSFVLRQNSLIKSSELQVKAYQISDLLINSQGSPSFWEKNIETVKVIGLSDKNKIIPESKVKSFVNNSLSYNKTRELFNIKDYDYEFKLTDLNNNLFSLPAPLNKTERKLYKNVIDCKTISLSRLVLYENQEALLNFKLFDCRK